MIADVGSCFGKLTVVAIAPSIRTGHGVRGMRTCSCTCSGSITTRSEYLQNGHVTSCGCSRGQPTTLQHGAARRGKLTPEYRSWRAMKTRCTNRKSRQWKWYGGRGIKISPRWLGPLGFEHFLEDMGPRPAGTSLDRFPDNNGDYRPGNCRWATQKAQVANSRPRAVRGAAQ